MCGIAGIIDVSGIGTVASVRAMTEVLRHRGPDDEGYVLIGPGETAPIPSGGADTPQDLGLPDVGGLTGRDADVVLGFRRLAILDVSAAGHQPMSSTDRTCWIVFNGEIYNYVELRDELRAFGHTFRSGTDTEVVLAAYDRWGERCVDRFIGMWAFAIWDGRRRRLFCSRDRLGIKPLYFHIRPGRFCFASEIPALLTDADIPSSPNERGVFEYLALARVDHREETLFDGIRQLRAAHCISVDLDDVNGGRVRQVRYWDVDLAAGDRTSDEGYAAQVRDLLLDSVRLQLRSDVAVGSCLSGGIDSSSIVMLISRLLRQNFDLPSIGDRQKTFTSCFDEPSADESRFSDAVVAASGAEGHKVYPTVEGLVSELPSVVRRQGEPFGGPSIYAQWNVFRLASERGMKVMLDGQGGDELFGGYTNYYPYYLLELTARGRLGQMKREWSAYSRFHEMTSAAVARSLGGALLWSLGGAWRDRALRIIRAGSPSRYPGVNPGLVAAHTGAEVGVGGSPWSAFNRHLHYGLTVGLAPLLRYEDRDSMHFSIEARVPFLDHRLVELAFSLPNDQKIRDGYSKYVLRKAMQNDLPSEIGRRTDKMGFVTPQKTWFRDRLADHALEVLHGMGGRARGLLDHAVLMSIAASAKEMTATRDQLDTLWRAMNLCLWLDLVVDQRNAVAA